MEISKLITLLCVVVYYSINVSTGSHIATPEDVEPHDFDLDYMVANSNNLVESLAGDYLVEKLSDESKGEEPRNLRRKINGRVKGKTSGQKRKRGSKVSKKSAPLAHAPKINKKTKGRKGLKKAKGSGNEGRFVRYKASITDPRHFYVSQVMLDGGSAGEEQVYLYFNKPLSKKQIADLLKRSKIQILNHQYKSIKHEDMKKLDKPSRDISWIYDEKNKKFYKYRGEHISSDANVAGEPESEPSDPVSTSAEGENGNIEPESGENGSEPKENEYNEEMDDKKELGTKGGVQSLSEEKAEVESDVSGPLGDEETDGAEKSDTPITLTGDELENKTNANMEAAMDVAGSSSSPENDEESKGAGSTKGNEANEKEADSKKSKKKKGKSRKWRKAAKKGKRSAASGPGLEDESASESATETVANDSGEEIKEAVTEGADEASKSEEEEVLEGLSGLADAEMPNENEASPTASDGEKKKQESSLRGKNSKKVKGKRGKNGKKCNKKNGKCKEESETSGVYEVNDESGNPIENGVNPDLLADEIASNTDSDVTLTGVKRLDEDGNVISEVKLDGVGNGGSGGGKGRKGTKRAKKGKKRLWSRERVQNEIIQVKDKVDKIDDRLVNAEDQLEGITRI